MNISIKAVPRTIALALVLTATLYSEAIAAPIPELREDGWYTWKIEAVDGDAIHCCTAWNQGRVIVRNCKHGGGVSTTCNDPTGSDTLLIYVRIEAGTVTGIHTLSEHCPIETELEVHDIGPVDNADSVAWLSAYILPASALSEDALAA